MERSRLLYSDVLRQEGKSPSYGKLKQEILIIKITHMEKKLQELALHLQNAYLLKEALYDKEYWINKASQETDFVPQEGDWISVDVTLFKIEVSVHHAKYGGAKYWKNGEWLTDPFSSDYPNLDTLVK